MPFGARLVTALRLAAAVCAVAPLVACGFDETPAPARTPTAVEPKRSTETVKPRRAAPKASGSLLPPAAEAAPEVIREYEIRLEAHRRELLDREGELETTKRALDELRRKTALLVERPPVAVDDARWKALEHSEQAAHTEAQVLRAKTAKLEAELKRLAAVSPTPPATPSADGQKALVAALEHELDVERANRATLEKEIQRLVSESHSADQIAAVSQSLDAARAEILLLNQRLATEQRARESLEVSIERIRRAAGIDAGPDWMDRFETTMKERRDQAERLQEELHSANEALIVLKGKLEAAGGATGGAADAQGLEREVKQLRDALQSAQQANADLRTQAELASRLAELLYGQQSR